MMTDMDAVVEWMRSRGVTHYQHRDLTLTLGPAPVAVTPAVAPERDVEKEQLAKDKAFRTVAIKAAGSIG